MKRMLKFPLLFLFLMLVLGGCGSRTVAEMYSLPKRTPEYKNLQTVIDGAMTGLEYAAPVAGENRQTVQMADLTGDGVDEFLVFAKGTGDTPLRIIIVRQLGDEQFEVMETISCKGAAFEQVQYVDFDGKSGKNLVVGRRINDQMTRIASVYSFDTGNAEQILSTIYARYISCDLNGDGKTELMVIRNGDAESSNAVAVLYAYFQDAVERSIEVNLSVKADQIRRVTVNQLLSGEPAVYVGSSWYDTAVITDVLSLRNRVFSNISLSSDVGTSVQTVRNYFVYAEDIDGDGVLELPSLIPMRSISELDDYRQQNLIRWYSVDISGRQTDKMYTYHNFDEGWYMILDESWLSRITVEKRGSAHAFSMWNENYGEPLPVFSVFTLTGKDRDSQAAVQNRFALHRGESVVYAGKLESASAIYGITEKYLESGFHLIRQEWKSGEI